MIENFIKNGEWSKAYNIAKKHVVSIPKEDMRNIQIALDCINGREKYYQSIGVDTADVIKKAQEFMRNKYL